MQTERGERVIRQRGRAELITEDLTNLEDENFVSLDGVEVVVHGEEDQKGSKHGDGGEEVPNVVVIKEREQDAVSVVLTRLCWSFLPGAETLEEEIQRKAPHHSSKQNTHQRQTLDSFTAPQLHYDVEGKVEQQVADADGQQVGGKVIRFLYEAVGS